MMLATVDALGKESRGDARHPGGDEGPGGVGGGPSNGKGRATLRDQKKKERSGEVKASRVQRQTLVDRVQSIQANAERRIREAQAEATMAAEWLVEILAMEDEEDMHTEIKNVESGPRFNKPTNTLDRENFGDRACDACIDAREACVVESGRKACRRCVAKKLRCPKVDEAESGPGFNKPTNTLNRENFGDRACDACIDAREACVVESGRKACRRCVAKKLRCPKVDEAESGPGFNKPTNTLDRENFGDRACDACIDTGEAPAGGASRKKSAAPMWVGATNQHHGGADKARKRGREASVESWSQPAHKKTCRPTTRQGSGSSPITEGSKTQIAEVNDRIDDLFRKQRRLEEQIQAAEKREEHTRNVLVYHHQAIYELVKQRLEQDDERFKLHLMQLSKYKPLPLERPVEAETVPEQGRGILAKEGRPPTVKPEPEPVEPVRDPVQYRTVEGRGPVYDEDGRKKRLMKRASKLIVPDEDDE
ncbi:hypothetical protein C8F04DRAFT_1182586 [Mycena alexandri]|uniref:Uncharacterized protein n=1 Tax=Mycena alexandri TaxID=1745969 RepID=A0AAD6SXC4_9AGAR|nr:hypothetical protein C8F04DRAFT_1182586 [Mycena alexandri]